MFKGLGLSRFIDVHSPRLRAYRAKANIKIRKILTASFIASMIVTVGPAIDLVTAPAANAAGSGLSFVWAHNVGTGITARTNITTSTSGYCRSETLGLNNEWGSGSPTNCNSDNFAGYGSGFISALSGSNKTYQFCVEADDRIVIEIGGTAIIDDWNDQGPASCSSGTGNAQNNTFTFTGSTVYSINVWFYENGGGAALRFYWRENSTGAYTPIPIANLATSESLLKPSISMTSVLPNYDYGNTTYDYGEPATGGTTPYTYSLVAGTLPSILRLDTASGSIKYNASGTNNTGQVASGLQLRVTDANGMTATTASFQITLIKSAQPTAVSFTPSSVTYPSATVTASGGDGTGAYSLQVVTVGAAGCSVSGLVITATTAGTCSVRAIRAADTNYLEKIGTTVTVNFSQRSGVIVRANPINIKFGQTVTPRVTLSNFGGSDSATATSVTYTYAGVSGTSYSASTTAPSAVGTYSITPSAATLSFSSGSAGGYTSSTYQSETLTISATIPGAPTSVVATGTSGVSASISFVIPTSNGGSAITQYRVYNTTDGVVATGNSSPISVTGLTVGTTYTFKVNAINAQGYSDTATASAITVNRTNLTAPSTVTASAPAGSSKSVLVSWGATANAQGYAINVKSGGSTVATVYVGSGVTSKSITVSDYSSIADGTTYTFEVIALGDATQWETSTATSTTGTTNAIGLGSTFAAATRKSGGFLVPISNYDATFTYDTITATAGTATFVVGGFISVTGLPLGGSASVTISTRKSGFITTTGSGGPFFALETATALTLTPRTLTAGKLYKIDYTADPLNPNTPTYSSSTTNVCTVSGETITPKIAGTCSISASLAGYSTYDTVTATIGYTVNSAMVVTATNAVRTYGASQTFSDFSFTGGTAPFTYSVVKSSDSQTVTGVSVTGTRLYFDTYTAGMVETFSVLVTDSNGAISAGKFVLTVNKGSTAFTITSNIAYVTYGRSVVITITANNSRATGTFTVRTNASTITNLTGCISITLVNATGTCTWVADSYSNSYAVIYSGDTNFAAATTAVTGGPRVNSPAAVNYLNITKQYGTTVTYLPNQLLEGAGPTTEWTWSILKTSDSSTVPGIFMTSETLTVMDTTTVGTYAMTVTTIDISGSQTTRAVSIVINAATGLTAILDTATATAGGFTFNITNYNANYTFTPSTTAGTITLGTATGLILPVTVTGLGDSVTATATITTTRSSYTTIASTKAGRSLGAGITPSFGAITRTATGFTVTISNYSASYIWTESVTAGSVTAGTASGSNRTYTVTGLSAGQSATLYVTDTSTTTKTVTGFIAGAAKSTQAGITVTTTSGTYPGETLTATGGSGNGALTFALAGPSTESFGTLNTSKTFSLGSTSFYSPDGSIVYILSTEVSGNSKLSRYVVASNTYQSDILLPTNARQMALSPDGSYILVATPYQVIKVLTSSAETSTVLSSGFTYAVGIAIDPSGSGDFYITDQSAQKVLGFTSSAVSKFSTTVAKNANNVNTSFYKAAISTDGSRLYVVGNGTDGALYEFNTSTGALSRQLTISSGEVGLNNLTITPDGKFVLALNEKNTMGSGVSKIYKVDLVAWTSTNEQVLGPLTAPNGIVVAPDSTYAIVSLGAQYNSNYFFAKVQISDLTVTTLTVATSHSSSAVISSDGTSGYLIQSSGIRRMTTAWAAGTAGCSVSGSRVSAKAAGTCKVVAVKATDSDYLAETSTVTTFTFNAVSALRIEAIGATVNYGLVSKYSPKITFTGFVSPDTGTATSPVYNYAGINGTSYASSTTVPTAVGTYSVTPSGGTIALTSGYLAGYASPINYVSDTLTVVATVPDSVTAISVTATTSTSATLTFTAPLNTGGAAITGYVVSSGTDTATVTQLSLPITISGLTPGTAYSFRVNAINSVGRSDTATATQVYTKLGVTLSSSSITGYFGTPIETITPTVRGGSGITYAVSPTLPAGLSLSVAGVISGTPTETKTVTTYTETATYSTFTTGAATFSLTILKGDSSVTTPTISPSSPILGQALTFTSTVTSVNSRATLTGTITFRNASGTSLCATSSITAGVASCSYTPLTTDTFTVRAFYGGMTYIDTSTSSALTVVPTKANPSITAATTTPFIRTVDTATITATIVPGTATNATGNVSFAIGDTAISGCSAKSVTSNVATCTFTPTATGTYSIVATYAGDLNYNGAAASSTSVTVSLCTQSVSGSITASTGAPAAGYCAVSITAATSGSLGLPIGVVSMKSRVLVIGGGGAGGTRHGGGGGAGSLLYSAALDITDTRTITIGAGGVGDNSGPNATSDGTISDNNGRATSFGSVIASGGGAGGGNTVGPGFTGGSSGGGAGTSSGATPTQTPFSGFTSFVFKGETGTSGSAEPQWSGGGGGGAGGNGIAGVAGNPATPGIGGAGRVYDMTLDGSYGCFAAGGGGGRSSSLSSVAPPGAGGSCTGLSTAKVGGDGALWTGSAAALSGAANTGSGGGGGGFVGGTNYSSGAGGSGLVALRYISAATITLPADSTVASLTNVTFAATAPLFANLFTRTYQWQKLINSTWTNDTSTSASTLVLTFTARYGQGTTQRFRLLVTDSDGTLFTTTASRTITLTVTPLTQPTLYLGSTYGVAGTSLSLFTIGGAGSGATSYTPVLQGSAAGCSITGTAISLATAGVCRVVATKAADLDYLIKFSETSTVTFVVFQIAVQAPPTNTSTGIQTSGTTTPTKGSSACVTGCVPSIASINVLSARETDTVVITGLSLLAVTKVYFRLDTATATDDFEGTNVTIVSDTQISVQVPSGLVAGEFYTIRVATPERSSARFYDIEIVP